MTTSRRALVGVLMCSGWVVAGVLVLQTDERQVDCAGSAGAGSPQSRSESRVSARTQAAIPRLPLIAARDEASRAANPDVHTGAVDQADEPAKDRGELVELLDQSTEPAGASADLRRSPATTTPADIIIANSCRIPVELVWLDHRGGARPYGLIGSGLTRTQGTFLGHVWQIRLADGANPRVLKTFPATANGYVETCPKSDPLYREPPETAENGVCSAGGGDRVEISMRNECDQRVEIVWVDFACQDSSRGWIEPGERFDQTTYVGHVWRVRDADGVVVKELIVSEATDDLVISCGED